MRFRFTLNNTIAGPSVIKEPVGWDKSTFKLLRDKEYHSLTPVIETSFSFVNNGGGREYIVNIESTQGPAAIISILIEVADDDYTYRSLFTGNLDLSTKQDISKAGIFYMYTCAIIPSDNWAKFINRTDTSVDVHATVDVDNRSVSQPNDIVLQLPGQYVRQFYKAAQTAGETSNKAPNNTVVYLPIMMNPEITNELNVGNDTFDVYTAIPAEQFLAPYDGNYLFDITVSMTMMQTRGSLDPSLFDFYRAPNDVTGDYKVYYQLNSQTPVSPFTNIKRTGTASREWNESSWKGSLNLKAGDTIAFFAKTTRPNDPSTTYYFGFLGTGVNIFVDPTSPATIAPAFGVTNTSNVTAYFNITADTIAPSTTADSMLIHDVANAVAVRMGTNGIYSDYLGGTSQGYATDGCGSHYAIMQGLQVRGYQFVEKLMSMSWKEFWAGASPIFNLGCGIEVINGVEKIRVERKQHFYNSTVSLRFSNISQIVKSYDASQVFKSIKIGYSTWSAESSSGIDDVQTSHTYSSPFSLFGTDLVIMSEWVAAALAIEQTRRQRSTINQDWRLDNNVMIVAIRDDASPEIPEQNFSFTNITGLFNASSRYNIRLSVYRNFIRWTRFLSGFMQPYLSTGFKFTGGEGNYNMSVGTNTDTCDVGTWSENQDILPSTLYYFTPNQWQFTAPLTFDAFIKWLPNRHNTIEVSATSDSYSQLLPEEITYNVFQGQITIKGWIK